MCTCNMGKWYCTGVAVNNTVPSLLEKPFVYSMHGMNAQLLQRKSYTTRDVVTTG